VLRKHLALLLAVFAATPGGAQQTVVAGGGRLEVRSFDSPALGVRKRYQVYLPASYARDSARRYPVAYLLHGRSGNEAEWTARGELVAVADSLFSQRAPELILVMPDGDNSFWVNWESWPGFAACARDTTLAEAAESFCVETARYGDYVARDLVAEVDAAFRTLPARAHRGLLGVSMGGTGALTLALCYPDVFGATGAFGAPQPFWLGPAPGREAASLAALDSALGRPVGPLTRARWGADTAAWWRHSPERAARRLRGRGGVFPAIRLEVGLTDQYRDENRALAATLRELGVTFEYREREGGHEWSTWRAHTAEALAWLGRLLR